MTTNFREIGSIVRLQIQRSSLTVGEKPDRVYDPTPLLSVQHLGVSPEGAVALLPDDQSLIDVHNTRHPHSQNAGSNGVSIGFTSHYVQMRERFGAHLTDGCAGENILIETNQTIGLDDLRRGVAIRSGAGEAFVWLGEILVAKPCLTFSRHALRMQQADRDSAQIKSALQFLENGMRGFYVTPAGADGPQVVSVGDRVYLPA